MCMETQFMCIETQYFGVYGNTTKCMETQRKGNNFLTTNTIYLHGGLQWKRDLATICIVLYMAQIAASRKFIALSLERHFNTIQTKLKLINIHSYYY